jgi:hypothetical protein
MAMPVKKRSPSNHQNPVASAVKPREQGVEKHGPQHHALASDIVGQDAADQPAYPPAEQGAADGDAGPVGPAATCSAVSRGLSANGRTRNKANDSKPSKIQPMKLAARMRQCMGGNPEYHR